MNGNLFCVILLALFLAPGAGVSAQRLLNGGKPALARVAGYAQTRCVNAGRIARVCKANDERNDDGDSVFLIQQNQKTVGTLKASRNAAATTENFHVFSGDLDKNGAAELVVVDFDNQSLGLGVSYYTVNIFPDFETKGFQAPLSFPTVEFGAEGSFVYDAGANETQILLGEWHGYDHLDLPRKGGVYFVGRYFRYRNGKLKPVAGKPVFARRYLSSFENERARAKNSRAPLAWFASPQTKRLLIDPEFTLKADSSETGTIEKFETLTERVTDADNETKEVKINQISVRLDSGKIVTFVLSKSEPDADLPGDKDRIRPEKFGLLPIKIALPADLPPTAVFDRFEGGKVRIDTFKPQYPDGETPADPVYKLWFVEE